MMDGKRKNIFDLNRESGHGRLGNDLLEHKRTAAGNPGAPNLQGYTEGRAAMLEKSKEEYIHSRFRRR